MNYSDPDLIEALAQRYVLGVMSFRSRRRFAQLIDRDPRLMDRVLAWEERLAPLALSLAPVPPSELVWQRIAREITPRPGELPAEAIAGEKRGFAAAAVIALLALSVTIASLGWWHASNQPVETVVETVTEPEAAAISLLADAEGSYWVARVYARSARLDIDAQPTVKAQADKDYQLWAVQDDGTPVSLGLLPKSGSATLALDAALLAAIARSNLLAVSLEPLGGSPQAVPSGPVLYSGPLYRPQT